MIPFSKKLVKSIIIIACLLGLSLAGAAPPPINTNTGFNSGHSKMIVYPYLSPEDYQFKITPGNQKGIYLTGYSMASRDKRQQSYELIDQTELNAIVFNAKDDSGHIDYDTRNSMARQIGADLGLYSLKQVIGEMDRKNIYSIARVVLFKDPVLAQSMPELAIIDSRTNQPLNSEGSYWPDLYSPRVWQYNIDIAIELAEAGVDEIQFDYIRAPARGNVSYALYTHNLNQQTKVEAITGFLEQVREQTEKYDVKISADVFGFTLLKTDDQGIGQQLEAILPYLDYLYPMPYPSHYPPYFMGFPLPEAEPYQVISYTLEKGLDRSNNQDCLIIPWIQAFGLYMDYTPYHIMQQIEASRDLGIEGYLCWNARNNYSLVQQALNSQP
ncbi:MAG: putative glycoside hydrolase [Actinomycetia bacterium]|nr:putative glycoside hydrolase [Actinomycetes bacterium]